MKTSEVSIQKSSITKNVLFAAAIALVSQAAMAAGFEDASTMATTIRNGMYTIIGVLAGLALLWQFVQGWGGRKQWTDILETCLWIVGAGAAFALATWFFTKGGAMSFS